ncbi:MAG: thymidine phosphorylase, partial [Pseudomonadota bacterium]
MFTPAEIIKQKRNKKELSFEELKYFIDGYTQDQIPDYQMSSLLMAIFLNGMSIRETSDLTKIMLESGVQVSFSESMKPVDKHSTGGVGDKASLILAPIVAACGVPVPMMSGRGLGHTGGTLDKLESIPSFNVSLKLDRFQEMVEQTALSFIGQTKDICPADKKIYALRDVTGTVESLPLICASIMSKKISEGIRGLVLDVKVGSGAFMKTMEQARALADQLIAIGQNNGLEVTALISNMNQPLGRYVGNSVEVKECISILKRETQESFHYKDFADTEALSLELSAHMVSLGLNRSLEDCRSMTLEVLNNGKAFEKTYGEPEDVGMSSAILEGAVGAYREAVERDELVGAVLLV